MPSRVIVPIEEGVLYRLGEIKIRGSHIVSPEHILGMFNLKIGDIADADAIAVWLYERVKKFYANLGYIQYTAEPVPEFHSIPGSSEGIVFLLVTVEEGKLFTIRSISFEGNGNIPLGVLRSELLVRDGDIFNQELLEESIMRLNRLELFERIDADRDVHYASNNKTPKFDLTIKLKKRP
ncbi:MAG TPA: POTRA domain-containing protein [Pyrinomonadaceae bacterium]|nr:POTRA domain-containing protein [Pyrinomonadaceae bacterium]